MKTKRFKFRHVIAVVTSAIAVVPLLMFGLFLEANMSPILVEDIKSRNLVLAKSIEREISAILTRPVEALMLLSIQLDDQKSGRLQQDILDTTTTKNPYFDSIFLLDDQGLTSAVGMTQNYQKNREEYLGISMRAQDSYQEVIDSNNTYWSTVTTSPITSESSLTLSYRTGEQVLIGYLNLKWLDELAATLEADSRSDFTVIDRNGVIIRDMDATKGLQRLNVSNLAPIKNGLSGQQLTAEFVYFDKPVLASITQVPATQWLLMVYQTQEQAFKTIEKMSELLVLVIPFAAIVSGFIALFLAERITRPISVLADGVKRISEGDYQFKISKFGYAETRNLGDNVISMAHSIAQREQELILASDELEVRVKARTQELQKSQAELEYSQKRYQDIAETVSDWIWETDSEHRYSYFSETFQNVTKRDPVDAYGKRRWDVVSKEAWAMDPEGWKQHIFDMQSKKPSIEFEYAFHNQLGELKYINVSGKAQYDPEGRFLGYRGAGRDVTQRALAEKAIQQSEKTLKHILDVSPIAVGITDSKTGLVLYANTPSANMFGYSIEEWTGKQAISGWVYPEDRKRYQDAFLQTGHVETQEVEFKRADETHFWGLCTWDTIQYENQENILFWIYDVTELKRAESELAKAKQIAEQATMAKSEFLANMSHEIRTPMNAVIGLSHLALQTNLTAQQKDYLGKIQNSSQHLLGVIEDVLDFSKIESGRIEIEKIPFFLDDVLEHVTDVIRIRSEEKGLEVVLKCPWNIQRYIIGDPLRLGQVLINLAGNAVKFTDEGEVTIEVNELKLEQSRVTLEFSVHDSGIGMTSEEQNRLFLPFSQADSSTTRKYGGTGLGLTISRKLIDSMGGQIRFESEKRKGTVFFVVLEFGIDKQLPAGELPERALKEKSVLIVDDNKTSLDVLSSLVKGWGMNFDLAQSGEQALKLLGKTHLPYDLIIMDWKMPGIDGIECAQKIRQMPGMTDMPSIVMVTAHGREDVRLKALKDGIDYFLLKPVSPTLLLNALLSALGIQFDAQKSIYQHAEPEPLQLPDQQGKKVLLVEDNSLNQQVGFELLQALNVDTTIAETGEQAIDYLRSEFFDAVLMDIQMPKMDGYETTQLIRESLNLSDLPVIAMTAHATHSDKTKAADVGMNDHITKPIDPGVLYKTLLKYLDPGFSFDTGVDQHQEPVLTTIQNPRALDITSALARFNNNETALHNALNNFKSEGQIQVNTMVSLIQNYEYKDAESLAHTLNGVLGNLGAFEAHKLVKNIEQQCSENDMDEKLLNEFVTSFEGVIQSIEQLPPLNTVTMKQSQFSIDDYLDIHNQLSFLLQEADIKSGRIVDDLKACLTGAFSDEITAIADQIEDCEYEDALESLEKLSQIIRENNND